MTILAATAWNSNAELMAAVHALGYLRNSDSILDVTYGRGVWWKQWRPAGLIPHDLLLDGVDFTALPEADSSVDAVAFDPPYAPMGGAKTSTLADYNARYGRQPSTPAGVQKLIDAGLAECLRVVRPSQLVHGEAQGGIVIVKCADYIWSGSLHLASHDTLATARALGFSVVDRLVHVGKIRPQPGGRTRKHPACRGRGCESCTDGRVPSRQEHARQNFSVLFVLRAPRAASARLPLGLPELGRPVVNEAAL